MEVPMDFLYKICLKGSHEIRKNYKLLGQGSSRKVYAIDENYVIKIPKGNNGIRQNKIENHIYNYISIDFKKYLCPIILYKNNRIIMPRAIPVTKLISNHDLSIYEVLKFKKGSTFKSDLKIIAHTFDLLYPDVISLSSWGIIDKKPFMIDYGCTNKLYDKYLA